MKKTILAMTLAAIALPPARPSPPTSRAARRPIIRRRRRPASTTGAASMPALNVGYEWGDVTNSSRSIRAASPAALQAGYNWQSGQFVFGVETDIQASGADDTFAPWKFSNPWFGTLRGRAGYALNNILFYGTLGLAYGEPQGRDQRRSTKPRPRSAGPAASAWRSASRRTGRPRSSISTWISATAPIPITGVNNGLRSQHAAVRRQLPLLSGAHSARQPRASRPGFFFARLT